LLRKEGIGPIFASLHPFFKGRQHALRPDTRFHPGPPVLCFSGLLSLFFWHSRRSIFRLSILHASTFLPPFAPRPLRRFSATMGALTPVWLSLSAQVSLLHVHDLPDHSVSTHPMCFHRRFGTLPLSSMDLLLPQVQASPFPSRLARHTRPFRVRHPTDWSFTSCCSPPRLAATQLQSVTGR
jgi:hypothetical protein